MLVTCMFMQNTSNGQKQHLQLQAQHIILVFVIGFSDGSPGSKLEAVWGT